MSDNHPRVRRVEVLIAPLLTFMAVVALLIIARFYDKLPVQAPECGFKSHFGIPCVACGGTRSMQAFSSGYFIKALQFNPAVILGVIVSFIWLILGLLRFRHGEVPLPVTGQNRRIRQVAVITISLLALNWIYLILFLK